MSTQSKPYLTPEQYLEIERKAEFKSEYYRGEMYAMAGASTEHAQIVANLMRELGNHLRGRSCRLFSNDVRLCVKPDGLYTYPDVMVICGALQRLAGAPDTIVNPTIIIEVLSDSTEAYDRGRKFELYRSLETMAEYILIASRCVSVNRFVRQADGTWSFRAQTDLADTLDLAPIDCHLRLADLYELVTFDSPSTV
jgi:Uma2 family endonuclease